MDVFAGTTTLDRPLREPVVAIGNFDGVHLGHRRLLALARERADARGGEAVVLTFDPHPAKILAPSLAPPLLHTKARKLELLAAAGIDAAVLEPFTRTLAALSAPAFVAELLARDLGVREIVVGYDFTYGTKRSGNVESLAADAQRLGIALHVVPQVTVDGLVASSTKIRELLLEGNVAGARLLLGRDFDVDGEVVRGAGRGRTIGVPTANVNPEGELLPKPGIYAVTVSVDGGAPIAAAASLGTNPTFVEGGALTLEAHLLDWEGDLYGRRVRVAFRERIRAEERFSTVEALVAQIRRDVDDCRRILRTS
jgi:riboflavin kinase/FMN adenylyltransferase